MEKKNQINSINLQTAEDRMVVVYATDDNYAFLAGTSMLSLLYNCRSALDIYILDDNISTENKEKLISIVDQHEFKNRVRLFFLDIKPAIEEVKSKINNGYGLNVNGHISFTTYSRLYLADIMPKNVEKVLYLDCDTVITNEGIEELYNIEFEDGKVMAAAADYANQEYKEWLGISRCEKYYNCGIIIIDLERWKKYHCSDIVFEHMSNYGNTGYPCADQDYINVCLRDKIQIMPLKYNIQTPNFMYPTYSAVKYAYNVNDTNYYGKNEYKTAVKSPVVIHYSGMAFIRPWYKNSNHPKKENWLLYFMKSPWKNRNLDIWSVNKYIIVREWMYKLLPPAVNGFVSGFFLRYAMHNKFHYN